MTVHPSFCLLPAATRHGYFLGGFGLVLWLVGLISVATGAAAQPPGPPRSSLASPVQFFRELLAMTPADRDLALAGKSEAKREILLQKVGEYEALPEEERERRLQRLELPGYLRPLLNAPVEVRAERVPAIPEPYRKVVMTRLAEWDRLPELEKEEVMNNKLALQYFFRPAQIERPVLQNTNRISILPPPLRKKLETGLSRWMVLSDAERQALTAQFKEFLTLKTSDQEKVLQAFPVPRQREMKDALKMLATLAPRDREECISGFNKFAELTPAQRLRFLHSLQRWQTMSEEERNLWRRMISRVNQGAPRPPEKQRPPVPQAGALNQPLPLTTNR